MTLMFTRLHSLLDAGRNQVLNLHGMRRRELLWVCMATLGISALSVVAGLLSVIAGEFAANRPVFLAVLPLVLAVGFTLLISPKSLLLAIIVLRAGTNSIFDSARFSGIGGLGGLINLAVIVLAVVLIVRDPKRIPGIAWWAWIPFMAIQLVGIGYSPDPWQQLRPWLAQLSTFAMFLIAFHLVEDFSSLDKMFRLVVLSSIPVTVLTLAEIAGVYGGAVTSNLEGMESVSGRHSGPFSHPNILAFYLLAVLGIVFYFWKRKNMVASPWVRVGAVLYLLVLLGLIYATKTRSAWVAVAFLFFLYGVFVERRYLLYLLLAPAFAMLIPEFRDRILDLGQGNEVVQYARLNSFAWRQLLWSDGLGWMKLSRYLTGYGTGAFFFHSPTFFSMSGGLNWGAHSVVVQLFFDLGIVGLLCYAWLFGCCLRMLLPVFRLDRLLAILFTALLGCQLLVSLSDNMLSYLVSNWYFWLAIGSVCALTLGKISLRAGREVA